MPYSITGWLKLAKLIIASLSQREARNSGGSGSLKQEKKSNNNRTGQMRPQKAGFLSGESARGEKPQTNPMLWKTGSEQRCSWRDVI